MPSDDPIDAMAENAEAAMQAVGDRVAEIARDRLDTPAPPSSRPGEHPHRRTGTLRDGISAEVIRHGDEVEVVVTSAAYYTDFLEASGRPVLSDLSDELVEQVIQSVVADGLA
jgi:hypothetical protein